MFVRRSRKGKIHMVRERVKKGYRYISRGLRNTNELTQYLTAKVARDLGRGIKETRQEIGIPSRNRVRTLTKGIEQTKDSFNRGVNSVHKSSQLALAKGHQSIQSGLKKIQKTTGDFNMYYQYEPPVAMFSMAEVDKYNRYSNDGMAYFAQSNWTQGANKSTRNRNALPGTGKSSTGKQIPRSSSGSAKARWQRASGDAGRAFQGFKQGVGNTAKGFAGSVGGAARSVGNVAGKPVDAVGRRLGEMAWKNPKLAGAIALGGLATAGAAGVGGTMFMRRRRSKSGKVIVEQVRR